MLATPLELSLVAIHSTKQLYIVPSQRAASLVPRLNSATLHSRIGSWNETREQRAANVCVWHLALMNRPGPVNVMSELKKYLTLDHAQCESCHVRFH